MVWVGLLACFPLYRINFNVAYCVGKCQSCFWPRGETSRSVQAVIENPHDSLLIQHKMQTADRGIAEPLGNKNHRQHTHCLSVFVKHTSTPAVSFCWATPQICKVAAHISASTRFAQRFYPQRYPAHINQLQIPRLIVFGQTTRAVAICYKQTAGGNACGFLLLFDDCENCFI